jgi:hypothetical protein
MQTGPTPGPITGLDLVISSVAAVSGTKGLDSIINIGLFTNIRWRVSKVFVIHAIDLLNVQCRATIHKVFWSIEYED